MGEEKQMAEHTPGQWQDTGWNQVVTQDMLPGDTVLAVVHEDPKRGRLRNETDANARLIAAAPELLKWAKRLLQHELPPPPNSLSTKHEAINELAAAIRKAEWGEV